MGVEIEMTGLSRFAAAKLIADLLGSRVEYIGGKTDIYQISDEKGRLWRIERDESIIPQKLSKKGLLVRTTEDYKVELVSPILYYSDIPLLQEIIRELKLYGNAMTNSSTGIHVHIGAHMFTAKKIINLCNIIFAKQHLLEKALMNSHRKRYCEAIPVTLIEKLNHIKPNTIKELADIWYETPGHSDFTRENYYHHSRYRIINIHQLLSQAQKTIEFRMFNGTLEEEIILAYIQFSTLIASQALNQVRAFPREAYLQSANDKYAFRVWLLQLGAIGTEYKTMRLYLIKHLEGNSAWAK